MDFGLSGLAFYAHDVALACLAYRTEDCFITSNKGDLKLLLYSSSQSGYGIPHNHAFFSF